MMLTRTGWKQRVRARVWCKFDECSLFDSLNTVTSFPRCCCCCCFPDRILFISACVVAALHILSVQSQGIEYESNDTSSGPEGTKE